MLSEVLQTESEDEVEQPAPPSSEDQWHVLPGIFRTLAASMPNSVLLETAKRDGAQDRSLLFLNPHRELIAHTPQDIHPLLIEIDRHLAAGDFLAGYFSYECGEHLMGLSDREPLQTSASQPLAWLGVFASPIVFDHSSGLITGALPLSAQPESAQAEKAVVTANGLDISREDYRSALERIAQYLDEGDTYQVNFTDGVLGCTTSKPLAVYESLIRQQPVPFAAFLNRQDVPVLSFSPELFYRTSQGRIGVRPMKGTWPRGNDLAEDHHAKESLRNDEKNRSEHVMIVDLLRNDLGRICKYGSIEVERLFEVETYRTVLQMTSTCSGVLQDGLSPSQVFASLFPSGSITGAPKRRTMQIIREVERRPRGIYTGAIGYFGPAGEACFNVAIRTLVLEGDKITMGVGGGITADSDVEAEFEECKLKAAFMTQARPAFSLFETMLCEDGIALLPLHLERLASSAKYFGIDFDQQRVPEAVEAAAVRCGSEPSRVRLELDEAGSWRISAERLRALAWHGRVLLADDRVRFGDVFLRHKTTNRGVYERSLTAARELGFDEVLFLNERGELTEGAISNLFVELDGVWVTPPLEAGALPGVQRLQLLASLANVRIGAVRVEDLARAESVILCNALRGIRQVRCMERSDGAVLLKCR